MIMRYRVLNRIYIKRGFDLSENEKVYLIEAYTGINNFWRSHADQAKLIILGEAPLWGNNQKYIYNPAIGCSDFFQRKDLSPLLNSEIPKDKPEFLKKLDELGIVILDVSPFALNSIDTQLTYPKLTPQEYEQIIGDGWEWHLRPKFELLLEENTNLVFRYARVQRVAETILMSYLNKDFKLKIKTIPAIKYDPARPMLMDNQDLTTKYRTPQLNFV